MIAAEVSESVANIAITVMGLVILFLIFFMAFTHVELSFSNGLWGNGCCALIVIWVYGFWWVVLVHV